MFFKLHSKLIKCYWKEFEKKTTNIYQVISGVTLGEKEESKPNKKHAASLW